jgi:hypothetical protein
VTKFVKRLGIIFQALLAFIIVVALIVGVSYICVFFPLVQTIAAISIYIILALVLVMLIIRFLYWLFIEPFQKGN